MPVIADHVCYCFKVSTVAWSIILFLDRLCENVLPFQILISEDFDFRNFC